MIAAVDRDALVRLARPDRRLRRGGPGRGRVPDPRPAGAADQRRAHRAGPGPGAARVRARPPAHDRPGPRVRAADARRHRDPRALAGGQRSDDGRAGARPDRVAARRAGDAPPGPVARRRRRRDPARDRPGAPLGGVHGARADGDPPLRRRVAADRAAAQRALRPPARGRGRRRAAADRARAPPARRRRCWPRSRTRTSARSSSSPTGSGSAARDTRASPNRDEASVSPAPVRSRP